MGQGDVYSGATIREAILNCLAACQKETGHDLLEGFKPLVEDLAELRSAAEKYYRLQGAGVDNWEGYEEAMSLGDDEC